jgi:hypothetical protein
VEVNIMNDCGDTQHVGIKNWRWGCEVY